MSMEYWLIRGVGINADAVAPHIDLGKLTQLIRSNDNSQEKYQKFLASFDAEDIGKNNAIDISDALYDVYGYENIADLLTFCDDTDTLTYDRDGEGGSYFYYAPSMPWEMLSNEPQTLDEVHDRIIKAVMKVTDLTREEILYMIDDDLYVVGCG